MTDLIYPKVETIDDACDWTNVIIWRMNAGARARSRSMYVPCPRPVPVPGLTVRVSSTVKKVKLSGPAPRRHTKTHTGTVIYSGGEKTVKLRETATVWTSGSKENYDKKTGYRVGVTSRCRLLLDSIKPIAASTEPVVQSKSSELPAVQLVAIMKGKTMSYQGIMSAIKKYHPDIKITLEQLQKRVFALCMSNFVGIERHDDMPVTHFTLKSVDPRFYVHSEKNMRA
ncbi:TPA: hypothetical protein ACIUFN_000469 [Salmonella enterica subsp. enterica serovar Saintpaul]|nr:hypothetical protein [Salmonella enterica]